MWWIKAGEEGVYLGGPVRVDLSYRRGVVALVKGLKGGLNIYTRSGEICI